MLYCALVSVGARPFLLSPLNLIKPLSTPRLGAADASSGAFFVPLVWTRILATSSVQWNLNSVKLFHAQGNGVLRAGVCLERRPLDWPSTSTSIYLEIATGLSEPLLAFQPPCKPALTVIPKHSHLPGTEEPAEELTWQASVGSQV